MKPKVAINGFGRIGKNILRIWLENQDQMDIVALNSTSGPKAHAHLFKYDSIYGVLTHSVDSTDDTIIIDGKPIRFFSERDPEKLPWEELDLDIVIEATGKFRRKEDALKHLKAGAKRVIITAPGDGVDNTIVMGVNEDTFEPEKDYIISSASCTTNCLAPLVKVIDENLRIKNGSLSTIHSYTADQQLIDKPHKDLRRARGAALSIIPTTTGAAKAIGSIIPHLAGKLNGSAFRVPTEAVSVVDFVANVNKSTTKEEVNQLFKKVSNGTLRGVLGYTEDPLVSRDLVEDPRSSIVDGLSTMVIDGKVIKVMAWYDNEYGYATRVFEMAKHIYDVCQRQQPLKAVMNS
ncbi:MAG TPA: type I glyceraldehyde-3-phosphate dehydrogenase [Thermoanaerobacterales bacterium]|nr:type I glyceraldehyde-3-phosphate dehydrogenase [Thermoanaerobacterales bacterium]